MRTVKRMLNPQVFLELSCSLVFAVLMLYLLLSGRYQMYVTPKMVPYFYFTSAVMLVWTVAGCFRLGRRQHRIRAAHCLVLAVPIILLLLPHTALGTADLSAGYVSANAFAGKSAGVSAKTPALSPSPPAVSPSVDLPAAGSDVPEINITTPAASADAAPSDTPAVPPQDNAPAAAQAPLQDEATAGLAGLDVKNKKITVSDDDFGAWMYEFYDNMDQYAGYQISIKGFVFKDPNQMKANEFVPARLMMSCCVADLSPCGLLCQYDKASTLEEDSWVTVEGTLHKAQITYDGQTIDDIQITVTKITPAEKVDGYIYPNY
ncbi:putative membrane protein [Sporobacter termitidis DSM 10068]|uniref:Putative membrane protein n=1 Tax=Sporobacter termitidis DSM 10068 TaxID=1123282 RepID=A0A1M5VGI8_9FIRM|nr:TIGR03943 family protein [Sporobacter termitidis]SHH74357.1 putative membrane protein [Sporobacter termitidis DSM 10068]